MWHDRIETLPSGNIVLFDNLLLCMCECVYEWEWGGAVDPICCAVYVYRNPAKFYDHRSQAYQLDLVITNANGPRNRSEDKAKQGKGLALNYSQLQRSKL